MTFFLTHWQKFAGVAALAVVALWLRSCGYEAAEVEYKAKIADMVAAAEESRAEALRQAQMTTLLLGAVETSHRALSLERRKNIQVFSDSLIEETAAHVANTDIPKLTLSTGFVRIHTNATRGPGVPPTPSSGPGDDATSSPFTEDAVLDVDVDNAVLYYDCQRKLDYWIGREREFEAVAP